MGRFPSIPPPLTLNGWLRYDVAIRLLRSLHGIESVLEIGAGEGALGWRLARRYRYVGLEPDAVAFAKAESRLHRLSSATLRNVPVEGFPEGDTFDLVCAFEVLEHLEDDSAALREWRRRVRPGGSILLSVPAWPTRWGALDEKAGHYRRYEPAQIEDLLQQAGFVDATVILYGFPLVYALQPLWNLTARPALARGGSMEQRTAASGRWLQPPQVLGFLTQALAAPFRVLQRPFAKRLGTGLVAMAQRPPTDY
jgi:SAM-dependent methyltransferase